MIQEIGKISDAGCEPRGRQNQKQLIVNADDLGICACINRGIELAHIYGIVTSASLTVNGRFAGDALDLCRRHPTLDVGIHLTLTEARPLSPVSRVPSLVTQARRFRSNVQELLLSLVFGQVDHRQVKIEAESQITWALERDIQISHIDSHQHWHVWPPMFEIVAELAEKYRINAVRIPFEPISLANFLEHPRLRRLVEHAAINLACSRLPKAAPAVRSQTGFRGFYLGGQLNRQRLLAILAALPPAGLTELMCHPAAATVACPHGHYAGYDGQEELAALIDPTIIAFANNQGISLVTHRSMWE